MRLRHTGWIAALIAMLGTNAFGQGLSIASESGAEVEFVVPLGIDAPPNAVAAFRVVAHLPPDLAAARELRVEISTELVPGVAAPKKLHGHPPSAIVVPLRSPYSPELHAALKYQAGASRLESPVIIAIADPRASIGYAAERADCENCERPAHLVGKSEADGVYELFTNGRHIVVRPEANAFVGTPYAFLSERGRMEVRVDTIMADTIRPRAVRVAAHAPPVADGLLEETTYLHSGELESVDGELGIARTYRSRTIGFSPMGAGWDASIFQRLRALPNGNVEYRDGAGELWLFRVENRAYVAPEGLFLRLARTAQGWTLVDQKLRERRFDALGRIVSESDEFFDPARPGSGNTTRYLYGGDSRLATIVDPYGRETRLRWSDGLLEETSDWRLRKVVYRYDAEGRLTNIELPEVAPHTPRIEYAYTDRFLTGIRSPSKAVTFGYTDGRVTSQQWATGETATLIYHSPTSVTVKDVLGQERRYTLSAEDRPHVTELRESAVPVWSGAAFGQLPASIEAGTPAIAAVDRVHRFAFESGVLRSSRIDGVGETTFTYEKPEGAPGLVLTSSTTGALTRTFRYQSAAFLGAVEANGKTIEVAEPHRKHRSPETTNSSITARQTFDDRGRLTETASSGGTDAGSAGAKTTIEYFADDAPRQARGRPRIVREGDGDDALVTKYEYTSSLQTIETDPRGVVTTTELDAWDRPVRIHVAHPDDDPLILEQRFFYDASGRLERTTEKKGSSVVTTTYAYDAMGRPVSTSRDGIATVGSVTTTTVYDLASRRITTTDPGGAVTTTELDALGRTTHRVTSTGSSPLEARFAYDLAGNRVFATDLFTASASAFDVHGRAVATRNADGTVSTSEYDEWHRPRSAKTLAGATTLAESTYTFTDAGRLASMTTRVDDERARTTSFAWDGGGRTTRSATNGRAAAVAFDLAGRMQRSTTGAGDLEALTEVFEKTEVKAHSGLLPASQERTEKSGDVHSMTATYNAASDLTRHTLGTLEWQRTYDELGNVIDATPPGREATKWQVDARGAVEVETLADGAQNQFAYDASGAQNGYTDPASEATSTQRDLIGRPLVRTYPDGTTEQIEWEGPRVKSVTDRQGRKQSYVYNTKGQLMGIRDDADEVTDVLAYDEGGRLVSWKTDDAEVGWSAFDLDGNPRRTSQKRFRDRTGLHSEPRLLDELVQEHRWNEHGERVRVSMPAAPGSVLGGDWTRWLRQSYDAMGNVTEIARIADEFDLPGQGVTLMTASYRGAGRADVRTIVSAGGPIVRTYAYDEATSLLERVEVQAKGVTVGGSETAHDGLQVSASRMLGVSSDKRAARFAYDTRSRLAAAVFGTRSASEPTESMPGRAREELSAADFRNAQERTPMLGGAHATGIDPPSATFEEKPGGGHKIDEVTKGPVVRPFGWNGAERVDDGRFVYQFDARGRLIRATEKTSVPPIRRITYAYTGTGRLIGRRAEYANLADPGDEDWKLEDRAEIITNDGLPAETTFVWDPISDRLVSVYRAGDPSAPLKQIIHGQSAYDDPLETTTATQRLYPIYDEAATGSLQLVLNARAEVLARNLSNDPYGANDVSLTGAAIDGAEITFTKTSVEISLRATERLSAPTLPSGTRLAALDAEGSVVRVASAPSLSDPYTVRWTLTAAEWQSLTAPPAVALSIAATDALRATAWSSDLPIAPAPDWALATRPVFTSPSLPFEIRESLASLPSGEEHTTTLYDVETLALLGTANRRTALDDVLSARFQALPFGEGATGLMYVRSRWYDPGTGTFVSPDPKGYVDSSNLYAFAGGDPVNGRDPTGLQCESTTFGNFKASAGAALGWVKNKVTAFVDAGGRSTVIFFDDVSPIDLGWVSENAREARRYNNRVASGLTMAAERGELTPVHVIGGAVERHRQAVASADCSEGQAAAATVALLDLATLRGAVDVPTSGGGPKLAPAAVTNTGAILPRATNASTASLMRPVFLANAIDDEGSADEMQLGKHGEMPSPRPGKNSHHGVMSQWMSVHSPGYDPDKAPAILMATENHQATFGVYNRWRAAQRRAMGGVFDWKKVSESDMIQLSEDMFNAAGVSKEMRQDYWAWYARMKNKLSQ